MSCGCSSSRAPQRGGYNAGCGASGRRGNRGRCTFCGCNQTRVNYVSYVIGGSYAGRNGCRSAFYSNCVGCRRR